MTGEPIDEDNFQHVCRFCGWGWNGRTAHEPAQCPRCKRYNWKKEEAKEGAEIKNRGGPKIERA